MTGANKMILMSCRWLSEKKTKNKTWNTLWQRGTDEANTIHATNVIPVRFFFVFLKGRRGKKGIDETGGGSCRTIY